MIEKQIEVVILSADGEVHLPSHKRESHTERNKKFLDVLDEPLLEIAFACGRGEREKIENIRVFKRLLREVRLSRRQRRREIRDRLPGATVRFRGDLGREDRTTPAVRDGLLHIPKPFRAILDALKERDVVTPGQFCNQRLQN